MPTDVEPMAFRCLRRDAVIRYLRQGVSDFGPQILIVGLWLELWSAIAWAVSRAAHKTQLIIQIDILPAYYRDGTAPYNSILVNFACIILALSSSFGVFWLLNLFPAPKPFIRAADIIRFPAAAIVAVLIIRNPSFAGNLLAALSLFALMVAGDSQREWPKLRQFQRTATYVFCGVLLVAAVALTLRAWYPVTLFNDYYELNETAELPTKDGGILKVDRASFVEKVLAPRRKIRDFLASGRSMPAAGLADFAKLYPPDVIRRFFADNNLPPDIRVDDLCRSQSPATVRFCASLASQSGDSRPPAQSLQIYGKASEAYLQLLDLIERSGAKSEIKSEIKCNIGVGYVPACNFDLGDIDPSKIEDIEDAFRATNVWTVQAGRLLFHHSYVAVPAVHLVKYGFSGTTTYLYGIGNTLFHAVLLRLTSPTLSAYFNTFPIAQYLGLLLIAGAAWVISRNIAATITAFSLAAAALYSEGAESILLAPGFSPLRYFGIVLQIAAATATARRGYILPQVIAFGVSAFWNFEFAVLALPTQMLIMVAPSIKLPNSRRLIGVCALVLSAMLAFLLLKPNPNFIASVQAGFFTIGLPGITKEYLAGFVVVNALFGAAALWRITKFRDRREKELRISLLPLIYLLAIKFLFNPSPPHLFYSLTLALPLIVCFWSWNDAAAFAFSRSETKVDLFIPSTAVACCLFVCIGYMTDRFIINRQHVAFWSKNTLAEIGDPVRTVMPAAPIIQRVKALREYVPQDSTVLILSPFDHLLSFYLNPKSVCGHFELLSNLVFKSDAEKLVACVKRNPDMVVVYDHKLEMPCPRHDVIELYHDTGCIGRYLLKQAAASIMQELQPAIQSSVRDNELEFVKLDPAKMALVPNRPAFDLRAPIFQE